MSNRNIKEYERVTANILHVIEIFKTYLKFRKTYLNGFEVFRNFLNNNSKIEVILKDRKSLVLSSRSAALTAFLYEEKFDLDFDKDKISIIKKSGIDFDKDKIIFHNAIENGDIFRVFLNNEYGKLNVKNKVVVDIGANIGDSIIYFALKGAEKIIGFEPFQNNFNFAQKNIKENFLEEKCKIVLAGCAGNSGRIQLDPNMKSDVDSKLKSSSKGKEIPLYSLHQIINEFDVPTKSILKMDCEGCEYDAIILASKETLRTFDEISLEYHSGYLDLKEKLEQCGFNVSNTTPISTGFIGKYLRIFKKKNYNDNNKNNLKAGYVGLIHAIKK